MRIADRKDKIGRKISREACELLHRFTIVALCRIVNMSPGLGELECWMSLTWQLSWFWSEDGYDLSNTIVSIVSVQKSRQDHTANRQAT